MAIEKVKEAPNDIQSIYKDNIKRVLSNYMNMLNIDDLKNIKPIQFNSLLKYIHENIFIQNDINILKDINHIGTYDINKLKVLCDIYINLCELTIHSCSLYGFSCISGISYNVLLQWKNAEEDGTEATNARHEIIKKIYYTREAHESNRIEGTTIGDIAILNHEYSWNNPIQQTERKRKTISIDDIPRLSASDSDK